MKKIVLLLVTVFASTLFLRAEDAARGKAMTGWICNSNCVAHNADKATCDQNCTAKSGDAVFIDDRGGVFTIAQNNNEMAKMHMGKHMKVMAAADAQQKEMEWIQFLYLLAP